MALISSVYIWVALGGGYLGDILFGLLVPIGLLIMIAMAVTFALDVGGSSPEIEKKLETMISDNLREIDGKLNSLIKEVEAIKKTIEE